MQSHSDHHRHTPHTHPAGSQLHQSNHPTTTTRCHTHTHTPAWNQTHAKLTQQVSLIHTNTRTGARQAPPVLGHMQALRGVTMPPWPGQETQKRLPQGRENRNQEKLFPALFTPSCHPCTRPTPAQPTAASQVSSPLQGPPSAQIQGLPHCPVSYGGETLAQPASYYALPFHFHMPESTIHWVLGDTAVRKTAGPAIGPVTVNGK